MQRHRVVGLGIHEMVAVVVLVTELERRAIDVDQLDLVGGTEADIGALARVDVADDRMDERTQISRRAMLDIEDNGGVASGFNRPSYSEILRGRHNAVL